jgi:hypothetical protein
MTNKGRRIRQVGQFGEFATTPLVDVRPMFSKNVSGRKAVMPNWRVSITKESADPLGLDLQIRARAALC